MNKAPGFTSDLVAMQDEMKAVAEILEATKRTPSTKVLDLGPTSLSASASPTVKPAVKTASQASRRRPVQAVLPAALSSSSARKNVTTRLSPETDQLLTEAALRQKLKHASPNTRQDIIEIAVGEWLKRHGYSRSKSVAEVHATGPLEPSEEDREEGGDDSAENRDAG